MRPRSEKAARHRCGPPGGRTSIHVSRKWSSDPDGHPDDWVHDAIADSLRLARESSGHASRPIAHSGARSFDAIPTAVRF